MRSTSRPVATGTTASAASANPAACASAGPSAVAPSPCVPMPTTNAADASSASAGQPIREPPVVPPSRTAIHSRYAASTPPASRAAMARGVPIGSASSGAITSVPAKPTTAMRPSRTETATTAPIRTAAATAANAGFIGRPGSWSGLALARCGVGRRGEHAEMVERPVAQPGPADDLLHGHRSEGARVRRVLAVVAHQEQLVVGDHPALLGGLGGLDRAVVLRVDVRLGEPV